MLTTSSPESNISTPDFNYQNKRTMYYNNKSEWNNDENILSEYRKKNIHQDTVDI